MAYTVADRVKETTVVTGTGPATLLGAASGYRTFASQLSIGDTCAYAIVNANASEWEVGIGTYSAANTLTRTTVHASTNSNAAVVFTAGTKDAFLSPTAETVLSDVTSTDGTVTLTKTGSIVDLSVAVAAATTNVIVQVRNNTGEMLTKGTVVYINDALGQLPTVAKALATSDATSAQTLGMISADLANNSNGYVTIIGLIQDINTGAYQDGDQLYLSSTVAGQFTATKQYAPAHLVYVGVVEYAHAVHGKIFVKVQNGYELDELHNVAAQSPSNGQTIVYNSTNQLWEKNTVSLTAGVNGTLPVANGGTGSTTASGARTNLGLVIGTDVLAPTGSAASLTNFPTLNQNTTGTAANVTGIVAVSNGGTGVTTSTGTGSVVLSNTPTLVTPQTNAVNAVPVISGAGNNLTFTAGSGVGTGAGGNVVIVPGTQATSGGNGRVRISSDTAGTNYVAIDPNATQQVNFYCNTILAFTVSSYPSNRGYIGASSTGGFAWADNATGDFSNHLDLALSRDAADTLAQRRSTNAQTFRVYNTYTDASNYERLGITWASNVCTISTQNAGTGTLRGLTLTSGQTNVDVTGTGTIVFSKGGSSLVTINNGTYGLTLGGGFGLQVGTDIRLGDTSNRRFVYWQNSIGLGDDSAGVLAQRAGTTAQTFRLYNTYTDASNYERLGINWASNICTIGVEQAGTGVPRVLNVNANNINAPTLPTAATVTAATGNGTTITYTAANTFSVGQVVSITGLTTTTGSSLNLSNQTITTASATQFTVTNATVGTAAATQAGTATIQSAGNSVTITAGSGSGVGAGGNIILQPGAQGTSGGNGTIVLKDTGGTSRGTIDPATNITMTCTSGSWIFSVSGGTALTIFNNKLFQFASGGSFAGNISTTAGVSAGQAGFYGNTANIFDVVGNSFGDTLVALRLRGTTPELRFGATSDLGIKRNTAGVATFTDASTGGGSLSFPSATTAIAANSNDLVLTGSAFQRINCTVASSLTGIAPPTGGTHVDGRMIRVYNVGNANLTLAHNSTSSITPANRFWNSTGADIVLSTHQYVELIYDSTDNGRGGAGWRVSSVH